uniref:Uncharacterized protein n=1 Tax=Ditylenchus dipsaci TaxID=166011 RepID=A0A915E4X1_9BILA
MYGTLQHEGITILEQDPIEKVPSPRCIAFSTPLNRNVAIKIIDTRFQIFYVLILATPAYTTLVQEYGENGDLLKLILSQSNNRIDEVEVVSSSAN